MIFATPRSEITLIEFGRPPGHLANVAPRSELPPYSDQLQSKMTEGPGKVANECSNHSAEATVRIYAKKKKEKVRLDQK